MRSRSYAAKPGDGNDARSGNQAILKQVLSGADAQEGEWTVHEASWGLVAPSVLTHGVLEKRYADSERAVRFIA